MAPPPPLNPAQKIYFALPREIMDLQLSTLDLLTAMFPSPGELEISPETLLCIEQLRHWCSDPKAPPSAVPPTLSLALFLTIGDEGHAADFKIQLNISVPLQSEEPEPDEAPPLKVVLRQPEWMSKAEVAELAAQMPFEDVFAAVEYVQDEAPAYIKAASASGISSSGLLGAGDGGPLVRVWFYFPSLSTREKRDDLVKNAPHYSLTGFVLAGKPGVLCLEGSSRNVDAYMKFIKTESWGGYTQLSEESVGAISRRGSGSRWEEVWWYGGDYGESWGEEGREG